MERAVQINQHRSVLILELIIPIIDHLMHCKIYKYRLITTKVVYCNCIVP